MLNRLNVYYNGWGESWLWGTLISSTATTGRPIIAFEYSPEANTARCRALFLLTPFKRSTIQTGFSYSSNGIAWSSL